ncbi:MAG: hypothetical protein V1799_06945 [bacterium]
MEKQKKHEPEEKSQMQNFIKLMADIKMITEKYDGKNDEQLHRRRSEIDRLKRIKSSI